MTIGVVILSRNYGRFLAECIASVKAQDETPRIVVVNDAGDDGQICADITAREGVDYIELHRQRGIGIARNVGAAYVAAEQLLFLDADDTLHPGALAALVADLYPRDSFVYGNYTERSTIIQTSEWEHGRHLDKQNVASYCNLWVAREFWKLGGYRSVLVAEDWDLQRRAAAAGMYAGHTDKLIFDHRIHGANKWQSDSKIYGGLSGASKWLTQQ